MIRYGRSVYLMEIVINWSHQSLYGYVQNEKKHNKCVIPRAQFPVKFFGACAEEVVFCELFF